MFSNLRNIAILMLVAGVSLGVFAQNLIAARPASPRPLLERRIEERLKLYREVYNLDPQQTAAVRRELIRHHREVLDLLLKLRREHRKDFEKVVSETEQRIREIIER
jgi:hypothetical protein